MLLVAAIVYPGLLVESLLLWAIKELPKQYFVKG